MDYEIAVIKGCKDLRMENNLFGHNLVLQILFSGYFLSVLNINCSNVSTFESAPTSSLS